MTNYQKLCRCVDIYEAGANSEFYDALCNAGLNDVVNKHVLYPNDEAMVELARNLLPAQNSHALVQSCDNRWFHARIADWSCAYRIFCPANCNERVPISPDYIKGCGSEAVRNLAYEWLEKEYVPNA